PKGSSCPIVQAMDPTRSESRARIARSLEADPELRLAALAGGRRDRQPERQRRHLLPVLAAGPRGPENSAEQGADTGPDPGVGPPVMGRDAAPGAGVVEDAGACGRARGGGAEAGGGESSDAGAEKRAEGDSRAARALAAADLQLANARPGHRHQ